jgi:signal transduction histidine kinase
VKLTLKLPGIVIIATLLTAIAISVISISFGRYFLIESTLENNAHNAEMYANALLAHVSGARSLLVVAAGLPQSGDADASREIAKAMLAKTDPFEYIVLLRHDGAAAMLEPQALEAKLSHRDLSFNHWFEAALRMRSSVVSDLHISPATQRPTIVIAVPALAPDGSLLGIWAGALKLARISEIGVSTIASTERRGSSFVTDRRGLIIAHQTRPDFVENQTDFSSVFSVSEALAGRKGSSEVVNALEGNTFLAGYTPLPELGWAVVFRVPAADALASTEYLTRVIAGTSMLLALLIGGGMFAYARRIAAPIAQLTLASRTIGTGDFSQRIEAQSEDEIGQLAQEFNRMTAAIAEKDAQLRTRAAELARSNTELEQFAYIASHDLQEPLRMVVGYVQLLEKRLGGRLDADTREFMGYAVDGALRMQSLIEDILAYSRVSSQAQPPAPVDSAAALQEALDRLASRIAETGAEISSQDLPLVMADQAQLVQLFQNLLSNAIKFCRDRAPRVRVEAVQAAGRWRFTVTDNGIGIEPEYRAKLFVIFKRLHGRREFPGTGIGLAICKRIIERHGGEIGIDSASDGGSVFWFTLDAATTAQ